ncbi:uncharacterized protein LOC5564190 [Aedes aegypti]|uniref:Uncharacterized protein n=1 Tax=Aedes aegypti TaxID=7159 RepID=A0A6I8TRZ9_AEDAE|nr:uncharacterized protein LOC5564190 [Aedes aegypti]
MPPKKTGNQQSVKVLIERINVLTENFRSRPTNTGAIKRPATSPDPPSPPKAVRFVEPTIPDAPRIASDDLADNPYAQEIFMYKTNVHDVVTRIVLARDGEEGMERRVRKFKRKLYRMFANEPKNRIRYPLDLVRFESSYYEYRFFLALHKPLHSDEQYQDYKEQLVAAGIAESWVTMRKNNRLLVYEDRIVQKLKGKFKEWSLKLDKLDYYLMDMHSKQPVPKVPKIVEATTETVVSTPSESEDNLLEQILKHSNANERFTSHQIRALFPHILRSLEHSDDMQWLIFENDELNKRFKLGDYAPIVPQEAEEVVNVPEVESQAESVASNSRSSSVASPDSEIAQMRSEMAMTQPRELIQLESSRFVDTQALVNVLEQSENVAVGESQQQVEELVEPIVAEEVQHELSPMITPAQVEVIEISDSPMHEDDEIQIKEEFLYTLDYFRKFTNIEQYIMHEIKQKHPKTYEKKLSKLDQYVERYYKSAMPLLLKNQLPPNLRLLSRKERKQRQASMVETGQRLNTSGSSSVISELPPPTTQSEEVSPITETPFVPRVPRKARLIVYEEDEDDISTQPNLPADTLPMPNTEDFLPPVCSTQLPCESLASPPRRRDTPFNSPSVSIVPNQSPSRLAPAINDSPIALPPIVVPTETLPVPTLHNIHPPRYSTHHPNESEAIPLNRQDTPLNSALRLSTSSSHVPTPAFDSSSSMDGTVIVNTKSPRKDTSIKRELNTTSYEDEVEFVEVPNRSILIEDSIELLPGALLERQPSNSCLAAFPDNLRGMVSTLFRETRDTTLSQGSGASSSGSGEAPAETQPMGFHQSSASPQDK